MYFKTYPSTPESFAERSPIEQPYPYLSKDIFSCPAPGDSPDPLAAFRWPDPKGSDSPEIFIRHPVSVKADTPDSFFGLSSLLSPNPSLKVTGNGSIRMDFGVELAGWLEIDSPDLSGTVTLGVSEYNQPAYVNSGPASPSKTALPKRYGNTFRLELNEELYEGVRFGFLQVTDFEKPFHITGLRLLCLAKPVNYLGSFSGDSELLNKIWYAAAYCVRLNLKKDYFAAILVDRGDRHSWTGDAYTAQAAALSAFGNYDFIRENLHYTACRPNGIESYELYWVLSLIDYYRYSGDEKGTKELLPQALSRLDHAREIYDAPSPLGFWGWDERLGAGFENPDIPENQNSYKLLAIRVWKEFSLVLRELGFDADADTYERFAAEKTAELKKQLGFFRGLGLHAFSEAVLAGVLDEEDLSELADLHFGDRLNRLSYSPFNQYFILQAMGKAGKYEEAVSSVIDLWGGQLQYGGTTFFETYRPGWNEELSVNAPVPNNQAGYTSLAHPWSSGVLMWMSRELLGIRPVLSGFRTFSVYPHPGSQLHQISGAVPTPYGIIRASFDVKTGSHSLHVPEGTRAFVGIPKAGQRITSLFLNGNIVSSYREDASFLYIDGLPAGDYTFQTGYAGESPISPTPAYRYPAAFLGEDRDTRGDWKKRCGKDGFLLCCHGHGGEDICHLPHYVRSIEFSKAQRISWPVGEEDPRGLLADGKSTSPRRLGAYHTEDNRACFQTFTVDISLSRDTDYLIALYFVDFDLGDRELAVEMFDLESLKLIAPVKVLKSHTDGVYLVYRYHRSARFRIDAIRGLNASLSGIFFDPAPEHDN